MMEGLQNIIGVLMMLGLILLVRRILDSLFLHKTSKFLRKTPKR
jgi:hypothetical protein